MVEGRIAGLFVYPVKGCRGIAVDQALVEPRGLAHDRRWLVVRPDGRFLTQREVPALARIVPAIEDERLVLHLGGERHDLLLALPGEPLEITIWRDRFAALTQSPAVDRALSAFLGRAVRLVRFDPSVVRPCDSDVSPPGAHTAFADGFPILLASTTSLARLNDALQEAGADPVPMARFRPSLVVEGLPAWAEDDHPMAETGGLRLKLVSPCERCIVATTDQISGERQGQEPIRTLRRVHADRSGQPLFGWNVVPLTEGDPAPRLRIGDPIRLQRYHDA
jgi:uncharacterized protein YcbX